MPSVWQHVSAAAEALVAGMARNLEVLNRIHKEPSAAKLATIEQGVLWHTCHIV